MWRGPQARPLFGAMLVVLVAAPSVVTSTRRYGSTEELSATEVVQEVNFDDSDEDASFSERAWAWVRAVAEGPWLALLLPLLIGLGLLQATLFHAVACHVIAGLKARPERWRRWRLTAAGALGAALGAQVLLLAGAALVGLRMHQAVRDGAFARARGFGAFYPGHEVWQPLQPFIWATPVLIICYWIMQIILCKIEEKKKRRKEKQKEKLMERNTDVSLIKITKL